MNPHVVARRVLDNYSRMIVASAPSKRQTLWDFLPVLFTAIAAHGAPEGLVSDSGSVFLARHATDLYARLGMRKEQIERGKPWMNYVESHFRIMKLMEGYHLAAAASWEEICVVHARFQDDYNHQDHFAHQHRPDDKRTPAEVLGWFHGRHVDLPTLREVFELLYAQRTADRAGYIRYDHWRIYGEEGLARRKANVWLMKETLTIALGDVPVTQYGVAYAPDGRHLAEVRELNAYPSPIRSPQARLWDQQAMNAIE